MNSSKSTVSVIMTVKNGEAFISQSITSLQMQTLLPLEAIIVDDGSTDSTEEIVASFDDSKFKIHFIKTGGVGRALALNIAWQQAKGDWVANLDVDDLWLPNKLECQMYLLEHKPNCEMVVTGSQVAQGRKVVDLKAVELDGLEDRIFEMKRKDFFSKNPVNHSSVIISRSALISLGGYNEKLGMQIDYDLWVRFLAGDCVICKVDLPLSVKRLHSQQSFEAKKRFFYLLHALKMNYFGLRKLHAPALFYIKPLLSLSFGFLPRGFRSYIKKIITLY